MGVLGTDVGVFTIGKGVEVTVKVGVAVWAVVSIAVSINGVSVNVLAVEVQLVKQNTRQKDRVQIFFFIKGSNLWHLKNGVPLN